MRKSLGLLAIAGAMFASSGGSIPYGIKPDMPAAPSLPLGRKSRSKGKSGMNQRKRRKLYRQSRHPKYAR